MGAITTAKVRFEGRTWEIGFVDGRYEYVDYDSEVEAALAVLAGKSLDTASRLLDGLNDAVALDVLDGDVDRAVHVVRRARQASNKEIDSCDDPATLVVAARVRNGLQLARVAQQPLLPELIVLRLSVHHDKRVRWGALRNPSVDPANYPLMELAESELAVLVKRSTDPGFVLACMGSGSRKLRHAAAHSKAAPPEFLAEMTGSEDLKARWAALGNPSTPVEAIVAHLDGWDGDESTSPASTVAKGVHTRVEVGDEAGCRAIGTALVRFAARYPKERRWIAWSLDTEGVTAGLAAEVRAMVMP